MYLKLRKLIDHSKEILVKVKLNILGWFRCQILLQHQINSFFLQQIKKLHIMSRVTKRKHVMKEMLADDFEHPTNNQQIAKVISSKGNNLHEVESSNGDEQFLASMPSKFRKNVWIKRGDFVIIEPIEEGDKVKAEIVRILTPQHIKEFTKDGIWPNKFLSSKSKDTSVTTHSASDNDDDDDDNDGLVRNTNRNPNVYESSDSDDDGDSDED